MCSLPLVSGVVARLCTSVHGSVSVVHGVHSVQNVLSPDGGFQRVFCEVCAHLQNVSDSVAELDAPREQVDGSEICARVRKKQLRTGFQPVEQKRNRRQIRELFPSGAVRGRIWPDLAKSGAPAAILINAYSGDFCHPVLSNALAQEPLVYHSGTRELFSDIFGTFSEISTFSTLFAKNAQICKFCEKCEKKHKFHTCAHFCKTFSQMRKCRKNIFDMFAQTFCKCAKHKCANLQMCEKPSCTKCANLQRKYFSKCRNHKSANAQICTVHNFCLCKFFFCVCKFFFV